MKYPIGIQDFKSIVEGGYLYIDKTAMVYDLVKNGKIYFLSRPRRFGKSLLVSTLEYYFKGEKELFKGLAIDSLEKDWKNYPVFHIDFSNTNFEDISDEGVSALDNKLNDYLTKWENAYHYPANRLLGYGDRFGNLLEYVHLSTGQRCVVLIDEYDKPLLDVMNSGLCACGAHTNEVPMEEKNRAILKAFYSTFKAADAHLQFVLLTGVTKFSQVSVFSGFNQPDDISMSFDFQSLCGITRSEIENQLMEGVAAMAERLKKRPEEMLDLLKQRYDGYHFTSDLEDIYNPFSLLSALRNKQLSDYWFRTGTPTYLLRLLSSTNEELNDLTGRYYAASDFIDDRADAQRLLPMFYQSGYLTIKAYDEITESYLLDFPNTEVKRGFLTVVANNYFRSTSSVSSELVGMVHAITSGNLQQLHERLTAFFASIPYSMRRKNSEHERERYFHYTFYLIFRLLSTHIVLTEKQQSQGRADCIIEMPKAVYIFEFKLDGTAGSALQQIKKRGYARPYLADKRKVECIGVSFSSETGTIEDWKVMPA